MSDELLAHFHTAPPRLRNLQEPLPNYASGMAC